MKPPVFDDSWTEDLLALYQHDMQEIWDRSIAPQVWNQYHNQLDLYLSLASQKDVLDILDVGCAQGTLALKLAEVGHNVMAVDLRQEFLDYAESRYEYGEIEFVQGNVLELELDRSFDLIFANQIVEHLVYPDQLLSRLKACLKPGGMLVMTTPNCNYIKNTLPSFRELGDPKDWEHMQFTADGDGHFYAYFREELVELFEVAGFIEVQARFFESPMISGHMKVRYVHDYVPVQLLRMIDRIIVDTPWLGRKLTHQLMVTGISPKYA